MKKTSLLVVLATIFSLIVTPASVFAVGSAGFENASYSARTLGQANAVVARPQDPSTITLNPAGIVELDGIQVSGSLEMIDWRIFHRNNVTGDRVQSDAKLGLIPTFYTTINPGDALPGEALDNRVALGVGVNGPFGLANSWPARDPFGDVGYSNTLKIMGTTIAAAVKPYDWISIGGGAIRYDMIDYRLEFSYPNAAILGAAAPDGKGEVDVTGHGWGWNLGVLLEPIEHHKLGFSYRSRANIKVDGRARIEGLVLGGAQGFPTFPNFETGAHSDFTVPANYTWAYAYEPSDQWAVEVDIGLTMWHVLADLDFAFDQPNAVLRGLGTVPKNFDDTISVHVGGHRRINEKFDAYGGFYFYQAAAPKKHVDNFLPDANRYFWSLGSTYSPTKNLDVDFTYFFNLLASRNISNPQMLTRTGRNIDGQYTSIAHGGMLTLTYRFDFPYSGKAVDVSGASPA